MSNVTDADREAMRSCQTALLLAGIHGNGSEAWRKAEDVFAAHRTTTDQAGYDRAIADVVALGCPICGGDCAAANPPVMNCWLKEVQALAGEHRRQPCPEDMIEQAARDVEAIRAHARRIFQRMVATPYGPKRKNLARQHVEKLEEALRAEGWNDAILSMKKDFQ